MADTFAALLRQYRERRDWSCNELARAAGCDPSYISRLERGEREPPRQRIVVGVARALQLPPDEQDRLLVTAGYSPLAADGLERWDPTLQAVAAVLVTADLSEADRTAFRHVVELLAARWMPAASAPVGEQMATR